MALCYKMEMYARWNL